MNFQWVLLLVVAGTLAACSPSSSSKKSGDETKAPAQTAQKITLPETELELNPKMAAEKNSFETPENSNDMVGKTFVIRPQEDGVLTIRVDFKSMAGKTVMPMWGFGFTDRNDHMMRPNNGPNGTLVAAVKRNEIYRFKLNIGAGQMKVLVRARLSENQ